MSKTPMDNPHLCRLIIKQNDYPKIKGYCFG